MVKQVNWKCESYNYSAGKMKKLPEGENRRLTESKVAPCKLTLPIRCTADLSLPFPLPTLTHPPFTGPHFPMLFHPRVSPPPSLSLSLSLYLRRNLTLPIPTP